MLTSSRADQDVLQKPIRLDLTAHAAPQVQEQQHRRRQIGGREVKDTQNIRTSRREAHWYLKDGTAVRLPVIGGAAAAHLELEPAGMHFWAARA